MLNNSEPIKFGSCMLTIAEVKIVKSSEWIKMFSIMFAAEYTAMITSMA